MLNKKRALLPLLFTGLAFGVSAVTPPQKGPEVKLPQSYSEFFPSMRQNANPLIVEKPIFKSPTVKNNVINSDIYGFLYYFQGNQLEQGFYRINPTGTATHLWTDAYTYDWSMAMNGGWIRDGKLCGLNAMSFMGGLLAYGQLEMDILTGEILDFKQLTISTDVTNVYLSTAYRDIDDRVYGYGHLYDGSAYGFKSAQASDIDTSEAVCEVEFEEICTALCYNVQKDMFYGVTTQGEFVSVTPQGEQTPIMTLNIPKLSSTVTGLTYSPRDNLYIYNAYLQDGNSAIYAIDADAKTCTKLYDCQYGEEYIYFVCTTENASADAPTRPTFDSAVFEGAALDGSLIFTMPRTTTAEQPLSGSLEWKIYVDGELNQTGSAAAGSKATVSLTGLSNQYHTFAFMAGKDGEWSVPVTMQRWIGADYPNAPQNVTLTSDKATWSVSQGSLHNGYVDETAISYIVKLNGKTIAETKNTECSVTLPEGLPYTSYSVEVYAIANGKMSQAGVSNYINYGESLRIPEGSSLHYYPQEYEFALFTPIDIDGKTDENGNTRNWHYSETMGFPSFASGADGDDLLIFPPIYFENADKAYQYQMEAGLISDIDNTGTIEVLLGKEPNVESMTSVVMPATRLYYMRGDILTEYFSVPEPGTYYLGVRTHTNNVAFHISNLDVKLTDRDADVPMTVTELVATAADKGELKAIVSFKMPEKTLNGKTISPEKELSATVISREFVLDKPYEGTVTATKTVTGKPGEVVTTEIETLQGYNTIGVSCGMDNRKGVETTTMLFTGLVRPYIVQNFKSEISEDNMSVRLSWTPPVEGEEDGEIGDTFYYSVWYYADGWQFYDGAGWDVNEAVVELDSETQQTILMLGVMAMNSAGQSDHIASSSNVVGKPYVLPMEETLTDGYETYSPIAIQRPGQEYNNTSWMVTDPSEVSAIFANDSGWAYIGYIGMDGVKTAKSRISLPKFSTEGCSDITITLNYWGGPYDAPFTLLSNVYGASKPAVIGTFPSGNGWISNSIALPETLYGKQWVELLLDNDFASPQNYAMFSGYSISGTSAIEGIDANGDGKIFTTQGMLHVAGFAGEKLTVSDMSGRVLISVAALDDVSGYALAPGVYVVNVNGTAKTVIVK